MKLLSLLYVIFFFAAIVYPQEKDSLANLQKADSLYNQPGVPGSNFTTRKHAPFPGEFGAGLLLGGVFAVTGYLIGVGSADNFTLDNLNSVVAFTYGGFIFGTFLGTYWVAHKYNKQVEWEFTLLYGIGGGLLSYGIAKSTGGDAGILALILPLAGELIYINAVAPQPVYRPENKELVGLNNKVSQAAYLYNRDRINFKLLSLSF